MRAWSDEFAFLWITAFPLSISSVFVLSFCAFPLLTAPLLPVVAVCLPWVAPALLLVVVSSLVSAHSLNLVSVFLLLVIQPLFLAVPFLTVWLI